MCPMDEHNYCQAILVMKEAAEDCVIPTDSGETIPVLIELNASS